jgi:hypothetical protein
MVRHIVYILPGKYSCHMRQIYLPDRDTPRVCLVEWSLGVDTVFAV